jgi:hypothetical protein
VVNWRRSGKKVPAKRSQYSSHVMLNRATIVLYSINIVENPRNVVYMCGVMRSEVPTRTDC